MEKLLEGVCYNGSTLDDECLPIQSASVGSKIFIFKGRSKQKEYTVSRWKVCRVISHLWNDQPTMIAKELNGEGQNKLVWDGKFWRLQEE